MIHLPRWQTTSTILSSGDGDCDGDGDGDGDGAGELPSEITNDLNDAFVNR